MSRFIRSRQFRFIAVVLNCVLVLWVAFEFEQLERRNYEQRSRSKMLDDAVSFRTQLESALTNRLHVAEWLRSYVARHTEITQEEFAQLAEDVLVDHPGIKTIQLAKDGIISHVYPLKGNESVLGLNLLRDLPENQKAAVEASKNASNIFLAGPVSLVQGGISFIARVPVFLPARQNSEPRFWGFVTLLFSPEELFRDAGLKESRHLIVAIRGKDSAGLYGDVFYGPADIFEKDSVQTAVPLPTGAWQLALMPKDGFSTFPLLWHLRLGGVVVAIISSCLLYLLLRRPEELRQAVDIATVALAKSEKKYRGLFENAIHGIFQCTPQGAFVTINPAMATMLGYRDRDDFLSGASNLCALFHDTNIASLCTNDFVSTNTKMEARMRTKSGEMIWGWVIVWSVMDGEQLVGIEGIVDDITSKKKDEIRLKLFEKVFHNSLDGIVVTDDNTSILTVNDAFTRITGYTLHDVLGKKASLLQSGVHDTAFYESLWSQLQDNGFWEGEIWNRRKNGEVYPEWLSISEVREDRSIVQYVGIFHDISEIKNQEERIRYQAFHDALTGLPNRMVFDDRLAVALSYATRNQSRLAVLFLDLDNFKQVNDTLGHAVGDAVLTRVADHFRASVRESDTVARLGGDEFVMLLPGVGDSEFDAMIGRIFEVFHNGFAIDGEMLPIGISIGAAFFPEDATGAQELLEAADVAMYEAKSRGKNTCAKFSDLL